MTVRSLRPIDISALHLDRQNPRLPEQLHHAEESAVLRFLYDTTDLQELALSFVDNGVFQHEPVLVIPHEHIEHDYVVIEGNRRVATLKILHGAPEAQDIRFPDIELTKADLKRLTEVPCYVIKSRDEVHRFLGFRHIGGIKTWSAEAKARYLAAEIDRAATHGAKNPFAAVGRTVGSNTQGVRNPYLALGALRIAKSEFGIDTDHVQRERFGVWLRCMNSPDIRQYIGLGDPRTHDEALAAFRALKAKPLAEVLGDLSPRPPRDLPLLGDSRQVTIYGRVIANKDARAALRKYRSLDIARQIIDLENLPGRILQIVDVCKAIIEQLTDTDAVSRELLEASDALHGAARTLRDIVRGRLHAGE